VRSNACLVLGTPASTARRGAGFGAGARTAGPRRATRRRQTGTFGDSKSPMLCCRERCGRGCSGLCSWISYPFPT
jgi:hypothetical protein